MKFIIKEVSNINSEREGYSVSVSSLSQAKRIASKKQAFFGTVLKIEAENGQVLAYKKDSGNWITN